MRIIFGAMRDKAVDEVMNTLFPLAAEIILTTPDQPRALNAESLAEVVDHENVVIARNYRRGFADYPGAAYDDFCYWFVVSGW